MERLDRNELEETVGRDVKSRLRAGIRAVIEQILQEEMIEHLQARHWKHVAFRRGERNGPYTHDLITPIGKMEQFQVPRVRSSEFLTEVFDRYQCKRACTRE